MEELLKRVEEVREEHRKNKVRQANGDAFFCECKKSYPTNNGLIYHKRHCKARPAPKRNQTHNSTRRSQQSNSSP